MFEITNNLLGCAKRYNQKEPHSLNFANLQTQLRSLILLSLYHYSDLFDDASAAAVSQRLRDLGEAIFALIRY